VHSAEERVGRIALGIVEKNHRVLNLGLMERLSRLELGLILRDKKYNNESQFYLLSMLVYLL
jgi:hypothetical protein